MGIYTSKVKHTDKNSEFIYSSPYAKKSIFEWYDGPLKFINKPLKIIYDYKDFFLNTNRYSIVCMDCNSKCYKLYFDENNFGKFCFEQGGRYFKTCINYKKYTQTYDVFSFDMYIVNIRQSYFGFIISDCSVFIPNLDECTWRKRILNLYNYEKIENHGINNHNELGCGNEIYSYFYKLDYDGIFIDEALEELKNKVKQRINEDNSNIGHPQST